jgi:hypothetical protein
MDLETAETLVTLAKQLSTLQDQVLELSKMLNYVTKELMDLKSKVSN